MKLPDSHPPESNALGISRRAFLNGSATAVAAGAVLGGVPAAAASARPSRSAAQKPVRTHSGLVTGVPSALAGVTVFKGIPYAGTTAGRNRWRTPQPAPKWSGVRKADTWGPACPQPTQGLPSWAQLPVFSEDCLNLNVWTGASSPGERRPVFVWLYGGRTTAMWTSQPIYDGAGLARKGLVVVTVNYRVDAFGGLATPELSKETGHNASGNWALLDQIAALKWVQENIAAFGGDPDRVTLAGWSHGAASTYDLIDSPLARGLFHRAQMESGVQYTRDPALAHVANGYYTLAQAEQYGTAFAQLLGVSTAAQLRALPADTIAQAALSQNVPEFRYVLDGWVMPKGFAETLKSRTENDVPILTGNNKDENGVSLAQSVTLAQYQANAQANFGSMAGEFLALYPASTDAEANAQTNTFDRDYERVSTFMWGTEWAKAAANPSFTYYWTHDAPGQDTSSPETAGVTAAGHGAEMNYVFDNLYGTDRPWTARDYRIADVMSSYVVNFAATGDPNGRGPRHDHCIRRGLPHWPALHTTRPSVMEVGDAWHPIPVASTKARLSFVEQWLKSQSTNW